MPRRLIVALFLLLLAAAPGGAARAQDVRPQPLTGWGITVAKFVRAAEKAGRTDWPSVKEGRPGTAVQVTFDPKNADITLVAPLEFGLERLLGVALERWRSG